MAYKKEFVFIIIVKVFFSLFAFFIYNHFSHLADSERYLNATVNLSNFLDRTQFVDNIFSILIFFISSKFLTNIFISIVFGISFYCVFKDLLEFIDRKLLYICFLLPSFQIWTSVAGKEILAIAGLLFLIKWIVNIQFGRRNSASYLLLGVVFGLILRPHYGIAYCYLAISVIILSKVKLPFFSKWVYIFSLLIASVILALILSVTVDMWSDQFLIIIDIIKNYFLSSETSYANRHYIQWGTITDYFNNIVWGSWVSIVGPTFNESMNRIIYIPFFIEGVFSFILMLFFLFRYYSITEKERFYRKFFYLSFIPALIIILMIHYPFGVFNPGAAIRYKQNITPLIYFYPLLVLACINESIAKKK
ncbi:TPA: hypothetical protein SK282_000529 [Yersinia enterocolitica]|nr:hypothetical protein [Yersinia enterocolitica]